MRTLRLTMLGIFSLAPFETSLTFFDDNVLNVCRFTTSSKKACWRTPASPRSPALRATRRRMPAS